MKKGRKLVLVIIGSPGSGKGTQGKLIAKKYNLNFLGTGDLIRELRAQNTALGKRVKEYYDKGIPQPDNVIIPAVKQKISTLNIKNGIIFDTFPLSVVQADALEKMMKEFDLPQPYTIYLEVRTATVIKRTKGRLICSVCSKIYLPDNSKSYLNKKCAKCNEKLIQRPDDKPKAVARRIKEYKSRMKDLKDYYHEKGRLIVINGEPSIPEIAKDISTKIDEIKTKKFRNIVILGPSGSGKGTQAELLARKFSMKIADGGEYLRKLTKGGTPLALKVGKISRGHLAPTSVVKKWLKKQIFTKCNKGFIISGQPRMLGEAKFALKCFRQKTCGLPVVILLKVSEKEIMRRLKKRYVCADCEKIYVLETYAPGKRCKICKGELMKRKDDTPRGIKNRLDYFKKQVRKTLAYFKKEKILIEINGEQSIEKVFKDILKAIGE